MKKALGLFLIALMVLTFASCMTHRHIVGSGAQGFNVQSKTQWYILWGLVPLNDADTAEMAKGAANYEIRTYFGGLDFLINFLLGGFTVMSRTVLVVR